MSKFRRYNKYMVLKLNDIEKYLTEDEQLELQLLTVRIANWRKSDNKPPYNSYVVVNEDEPYSEKVWALIEESQSKS